jgi:arylsulfatase A-like enzyme
MGNPIVQTPNLDALAADGVVFDNAFATTSICCSSRASIITGQYTRRHKIWSFNQPLSPEAFAKTFPALLRANGYRTGFVGKWGIGGKMPAEEFDFWAGFPGQGRYYEGDKPHVTRRLAEKTQEFLAGCSADQPFCLQMSFKAAHCQDGADWQFQHDHAYDDLYKDQRIEPPTTATEEDFARLPKFLRESEARVRWKVRFNGDEMYQKSVKDYYRLITGVDRVIGEFVDTLRRKGLADNTVIIFTADQGFYLGDYGLAGKWYMHEPSIRIPLIVHDPRLPKELRGTRLSQMALTLDLAPTILDLAGIAVPDVMQGRSLVPLTEGEEVEWRDDWLYEHLFKHARIPKSEGVRTGDWTYVRYVDFEPVYEELYNLKTDPLERKNLADVPEFKKKLTQLRKRCDELIREAE